MDNLLLNGRGLLHCMLLCDGSAANMKFNKYFDLINDEHLSLLTSCCYLSYHVIWSFKKTNMIILDVDIPNYY